MLTVGEILRRTRQYKKVSLSEVAEETKINKRFLKHIERDELDKFDSKTQLYGFIKNFATFLEVDERKITAIYKRQVDRREPVFVKQKKRFALPNITITYKQLGALVGVLFMVMIFGYLVVQFYRLQQPPKLELVSPNDTTFTTTDETLTIDGVTEPDVYLSINGQQVNYDKNSVFSFQAPLKEGTNTFKIVAQAQYNEEKRTTIQLVVKKSPPGENVAGANDERDSDSAPTTPTPSPTSQKMNIGLAITTDQAWIQVVVDDIQKLVGIYPNGTNELYEAEESFYIISGRPNITKVTVNGEEKPWVINNGIGSVECQIEKGKITCEE